MKGDKNHMKTKTKIRSRYIRLRDALRGTVTKKQPGGKEIIIEMLLAAVVIALAILWKTGISGVITDMITGFTTKISGIMG